MNSKKTIERLLAKSRNRNNIMPPITAIHQMLEEFGIEHKWHSSNIVEHKGIVGARNQRKEGYSLRIPSYGLHMDTSESHYSENSKFYADRILDILRKLRKI